MRHKSLSCIALLSIILFTGCGQPDRGVIQPTMPAAAPPQTQVPSETPLSSSTADAAPPSKPTQTPTFFIETKNTISDPIYFESPKEQVAKASIIVLGTVREKTEVINTSRDVEDITKPARDSFSVGQVYTVQVSTYFKGKAEDTIRIVNHEGSAYSIDAQAITPAIIEQIKAASPYTPLEIGTAYLFFARPFTGSDLQGVYYIAGGGYPWQYRDNKNGTFTGLDYDGTPLDSDASTFKQGELFAQIEQLVKAEGQK